MNYASKFHWMVWLRYEQGGCQYGVPVNSVDEATVIANKETSMGAIEVRIFAPCPKLPKDEELS